MITNLNPLSCAFVLHNTPLHSAFGSISVLCYRCGQTSTESSVYPQVFLGSFSLHFDRNRNVLAPLRADLRVRGKIPVARQRRTWQLATLSHRENKNNDLIQDAIKFVCQSPFVCESRLTENKLNLFWFFFGTVCFRFDRNRNVLVPPQMVRQFAMSEDAALLLGNEDAQELGNFQKKTRISD